MGREGINLKLLEIGSIVLVETKNSVYQIKVVGSEGKITIIGGMTSEGVDRFPIPVEAAFIGSFEGVLLERHWIGKGLKMEMIVGQEKFLSSEVTRAEVEAPDGSWRYCMDWD